MAKNRRVDIRRILANPDMRRQLMIPTLQATQAREGIDTTAAQAERAYYVVTEGERIAFFDLDQFRGGKGQSDRRHEAFVRALIDDSNRIRCDVPRRDFGTIEGSPLAYRRVGVVAHVFRDNPPLEPSYAIARQGLSTANDPRFVRMRWEVRQDDLGAGRSWRTFAKGGDFARFYQSFDLVVLWRDNGSEIKAFNDTLYGKGGWSRQVRSVEHYFKPGLTWPLRTQRGFNLRVMPEGCVFGHKGPAVFPSRAEDAFYILGVANSHFAEYLLQGLTSFGSWEVGAVKRLPIPQATQSQRQVIGELAKSIHDAKARWDAGDETTSQFKMPWLLRSDFVEAGSSVCERLDRLAGLEQTEESHIRELYSALNDEVYRLYGVPPATRSVVEDTLGARSAEIIWPRMEGKTPEQKRMEHVFRLLSYVVKRVVDRDDDGIVPFAGAAGEAGLLERVQRELGALIPEVDITQVEAELANELKRSVKGYRRAQSIGEWLGNAFFEYHAAIYRGRPIIWHVASRQGAGPFAFGALVHYHRFDRNRMGKLRAQYVRDAVDGYRREAALADKAGDAARRVEWQAYLEETMELDRRLQSVEEGRHEGPEGGEHDFRILTPWKSEEHRPRGWDPDLDDGVKVNIRPFEAAGLLRVASVT